MSFLTELRRRKVVRTALLYVALGWGAVEVTSTVGQVFEWPSWLVRTIVVAIFLGLPVAIVVSWMFDITPDGLLPDDADEEARGSKSGARTPHADSEAGPDPTSAGARIDSPPPEPATPLLGRDEAVQNAVDRLAAGTRVLTVTGTGGTGKTRFSIELFRRLQAEYPEGGAFVSLASVEQADEVMSSVAATIGIAEAHGRTAVSAVATVIGDQRVLLVLDNLEQVLDCAPDVADLIARCPNLHVIATSRAPLKIGAESELALPPLALPPEGTKAPEDLSLYPAVELFVERASKVKADFRVDAENAEAIVGICRRLDGLPLALELAAARIRILDPAALLGRLDHALDVLTSGDRDLPARQRTLRATVNWSYSLLDEGEQRLLRRSSVFSEGWSLEAMEAVCYVDDARERALDELNSLVEKGLVQVAGSGDRYLLLVTIREFASAALQESGEAEAIHRAHLAHFVAFGRQVHRGITGRRQVESMRLARIDSANTHDALQWATARAREGDEEALELGLLLAGFQNWVWHIGGQHLTARGAVDGLLALAREGETTPGRVLSLTAAGMVSISTGEIERGLGEWQASYDEAIAIGDDSAASQAGVGLGFTHCIMGSLEPARSILEDTIERSRAAGEEFMEAVAIAFLGNVHGVSGDLPGGIELIEKAHAQSVRIGDFEGGGVALSFLAQLRFMEGDTGRALEHYAESLIALQTIGDRPEIARVHGEMGWAALSMDRVDAARDSFLASLREYDEVGSARGAGTAMTGLAVTEAADGRAERALRIAAAADVLAEQAGVIVVHAMGLGAGDQIQALREGCDDDRLSALTEEGRAMSPAQVLAMVSDREPRRATVGTAPSGGSPTPG